MLITIETLILVADWKKPALFQGRFTLFDNERPSIKKVYFFSALNELIANKHEEEEGIQPMDYRFRELMTFNGENVLDTQLHQLRGDMLYILKYALSQSVQLMRKNRTNDQVSFDEVAIEQLSEMMMTTYQPSKNTSKIEDVGFEVSIDFSPSEPRGEAAINLLLGQNSLN